MNKDRYGFRGERLRPPVAPSLRDFPRSLRVHYGVAPFWLQTLFDNSTSLASPTPPASLRCRCATLLCQPGNLRLLFRAANAGLLHSLLQSHGRHTSSHILPTHRRCSRQHSDAHGYLRLSSATLIIRPRAEMIIRRRPMARAMLSTPPGMWRLPSLRTLPPSLLCVLIHRQPRASLFTATLLSAVNKDRFGLRVERLRPASSLRDARHPPASGSAAPLRLRSQTLFDGYTLAIPDTSGYAYGVGSLPLRSQPEPALAFPARRCQAAALPPMVGASRQSPRSSHP